LLLSFLSIILFIMASLQIQKRQKGKYYTLIFRVDGRRESKTLGYITRQDAARALADAETAEKQGRILKSADEIRQALNVPSNGKTTLCQLEKIYFDLRKVEIEKKAVTAYTVKRQLYSLRLFIEIIGNKELNQLTPDDLERFKAERLIKISARGSNHDLDDLKTVLRWAFKRRYLSRPVYDFVDFFRTDKRTPPVYEQQELVEIEKHLTVPMYFMAWQILKFAPMRRSELCRLTWQDIAEDFKFFRLRETKAKIERTLPIADSLKNKLLNYKELLKPAPDDLIISCHPDTLTQAFSRAEKQAGLKKAGAAVHILRHSAGYNLAAAGFSDSEISKLLGNTPEMARHYSRLADARKLETINKLYNNDITE